MSAVQFTAEWQGNSIHDKHRQKRDDDTTQRKRHSGWNAFFF